MSNLEVSVVRAADLLALRFEFVNLVLATTQGQAPRLLRSQGGLPAFIIVHFPPQHIAENTFIENSQGQLQDLLPPPIQSILAAPSRLAFRVPDAILSIPFTFKDLLTWTNYELVVAENALPDPPGQHNRPGLVQPRLEQTAIELPYGLVLSPDSSAGWEHATSAVTHKEHTELWHTRLGVLRDNKVDESGLPAVRAIWSAHPRRPISERFADDHSPLPAAQRTGIAQASADFSLHEIPVPLKVTHLMLSQLGAWTDLSLDLVGWHHVVSMGRDQYVRVVKKGFLYPFCHRCSLVTITERKFNRSPSGELVAYLAKRGCIVVQEPQKDYSADELMGAYASKHGQGGEMPLRRVTIITQVTRNLSNVNDPGIFLPRIGAAPFRFEMTGEDWEGHQVDFLVPLVFVPVEEAADVAKMRRLYEDARQADLHGQKVALAPSPDKPGATSLATASLFFSGQDSGDGPQGGLKVDHLPPGHPPFLPFVDKAEVSIAAIDQFSGSSGASEGTTITIAQAYLEHGIASANNAVQVFANVMGEKSLKIPADRAGGLATPQMMFDGLSRNLGPVANASEMNLGKFDLSKILGDAKLLGINLSDILQPPPPPTPLPGQPPVPFTPGKFHFEPSDLAKVDLPPDQLNKILELTTTKIQVPVLTTRTLSDSAGKPTAIETRFLWKPEVHNVGPFKTKPTPANPTQLILTANMLTQLNGGQATTTVKGSLTNFDLNLLGVITISFAKLSFESSNGSKMDLRAEGIDVEFTEALKFINTLAKVLPAKGFSDGPSIAIRPDGISTGYSLGIPSAGVGAFSLENIALSAELFLPFVDKPAGLRLAFSTREHPFLVTISMIGGGGFFAIVLNTKGIEKIEGALEVGGNITISLVITSANVQVMAGFYFGMTKSDGGDPVFAFMAYVRVSGSVEVLGLVGISIEFYVGLKFQPEHTDPLGVTHPASIKGEASVTIGVHVLMFTKSISLSVGCTFDIDTGELSLERVMLGGGTIPSGGSLPLRKKTAAKVRFEDMVTVSDWTAYCRAFA